MVAGNVAEDRAPGGWAPGGPSLYTARMCVALGARVTLVSAIPHGYPADALDGISVSATPGGQAARYANTYDDAGHRTQLLLQEGSPIPLGLVQDACRDADALFLAPAYHELSGVPPKPPGLVAVALQGLLRTHDDEGRVSPLPEPWPHVQRFARDGAFVFYSDEDTAHPETLASAASLAGAHVLVTRGARGATHFAPGLPPVPLAALPATPVEPTGAGDCFAAAFAVRMLETSDLTEACRWALAAGALAIQAPGLAGVPTRGMIEAHLRREAA